MTPRLRDAFDRMLVDEPPLELTVDAIVAGGERRAARVRRVVGLSTAAAVLLVVGIAAVVTRAATSGDGDGRVSVTAPADSDAPVDEVPSSAPTSGAPTTTPVTTAPDPEPGSDGGLGTGPDQGPGTTAGPGSTVVDPPAGAAVTSGELLGDPGFEAAPPGWSDFGAAPVLTPVTGARTGAHALHVAGAASGEVVAGATNRPATVLTEAGRRYRASCWARADGAAGAGVGVRVQVQEYTTGWERVTDPAPSAEVVLAEPGRWYPVTVTYTAQGSGRLLPLSVFSNDVDAGGPGFVVDDCSLVTLG